METLFIVLCVVSVFIAMIVFNSICTCVFFCVLEFLILVHQIYCNADEFEAGFNEFQNV